MQKCSKPYNSSWVMTPVFTIRYRDTGDGYELIEESRSITLLFSEVSVIVSSSNFDRPRTIPKGQNADDSAIPIADIITKISSGIISLPSGFTTSPSSDESKIIIKDSSGNIVFPCWTIGGTDTGGGTDTDTGGSTDTGGGTDTGTDTGGGTDIGGSTDTGGTTSSNSGTNIYTKFEKNELTTEEQIELRLSQITHPSDLNLFEFSLLAADYINSYPIPKNIQTIVENALPNVFLDQSKRTNLPLSSHPYDSGSMYQLFRTPKFDNVACIMEDTISQPFNSFHFYFNSNRKNLERFGGIDSSSNGSSHRTKVIVNSNVSGYMVPRAKDGTGYVTNSVNNGGIHVYTADNLFMTVDRELHAVANTDGYLKFGQNANLSFGSRKSKPAVAVVPRDFYETNEKFDVPITETNLESHNNLNILSHNNEYTKLTSANEMHLRVTREQYIPTRKILDGSENIEEFKNVDNLKDRCDEQPLDNLYVAVSDNIHLVSGGILRMSIIKGVTSSVSLPIDVNGSFTVRTYSGHINLETHNVGNIGLTTVHGGDIVLNSQYQGGIVLKTHDGDIINNTEHKGSIYNIVDCDGDIEMVVNKTGFINIKTYEGEINLESRYQGNVNIKARSGDINIQTTLAGKIDLETKNGSMNLYTFHDMNMENINTDINILSHDGNINIFARNDVKCPMVNIKSQNSVIIDAPIVYIRYGDVVIDGTLHVCKIIADKEILLRGDPVCTNC